MGLEEDDLQLDGAVVLVEHFTKEVEYTGRCEVARHDHVTHTFERGRVSNTLRALELVYSVLK